MISKQLSELPVCHAFCVANLAIRMSVLWRSSRSRYPSFSGMPPVAKANARHSLWQASMNSNHPRIGFAGGVLRNAKRGFEPKDFRPFPFWMCRNRTSSYIVLSYGHYRFANIVVFTSR